MNAKTLRCGAVVLLMAALAGGCTALIDSSQYVGQGSDGGTADAQVDRDAPSTPQIELGPATPRTTDTLSVTITTESVDPLSGTVEYEYRWLRDGTPVDDETGASLDASLTRKGETWRVEVTPVATPGSRRGAPAVAEVTIVNTPPVLDTVGFDTYHPRVGETLRALPGTVRDADGDVAALRFRWFANDEPIDGPNTATLATASHPADTEIRIEVWADDGDAGPVVSAGPVRLAPDETHWRQVLPDLGLALARIIWDAPRARAVRMVDGGMWEYVLGPDGLRVTQLAPRGTPPNDGELALFLHDEVNERLLVINHSERSVIHALDLSQRGGESWTQIETTGSTPDIQLFAISHFDAATRRFWIFGGFDDADEIGALDQVFSLDVSTPGAERWTPHTPEGAFPRIYGAAIAADPGVPGRAYLLGGVTTPTPSVSVAREQIVQLDLTTTGITATELSTVLPTALWGAAAAPDPSTGNILIFGGLSAFSATATPLGMLSFDPRTGTITTIEVPGGDTYLLGSLTASAYDSGFVAISPFGDTFGGDRLAFLRVSHEGATRIATEERPSQLYEALGIFNADALRVVGGRGDADTAHTESWTVDVATWRWSRMTTRDDIVTMTSPQARFGVLAQTGTGGFSGNELVMAGGSLAEGALADMQVWRLRDDQRWMQHTLRAGATPLPPRTAHATFGVSCGQGVVGVFGGMDATSSTLFADTAMLECTSDRSCEWRTDIADEPTPRRHAPVVQVDWGAGWLFGGKDATGSQSDVYAFQPCASPPTWVPVTPTGIAPTPRHGHSAVAVGRVSGGFDSILYFGGQTDDPNLALNDVHRLVLRDATSASWEAIAVEGVRPSERAHHLAFWDPGRNRMVVIGGRRPVSGPASDVWELRIRP